VLYADRWYREGLLLSIWPPLIAHVLLNATATVDVPAVSMFVAAIVLANGLLLAGNRAREDG
jgi:hypothetical protein